jgi:cell wall-associated NlpC family hydrolase
MILTIFFTSCDTEKKAINDADSNSDDSNFTEVSIQQDTTKLGEKIINYAATLKGTPYKVAGRDTTGFDCSGFIYYVFKHYHVEVPHSSRHLAELGTEVDTSIAKPGDLVFFKGTNPNNPEVGHVGIVVSKTGEPVKFIHASSATTSAYVKYDSLARPNYRRRFLKVKRVLTDSVQEEVK